MQKKPQKGPEVNYSIPYFLDVFQNNSETVLWRETFSNLHYFVKSELSKYWESWLYINVSYIFEMLVTMLTGL